MLFVVQGTVSAQIGSFVAGAVNVFFETGLVMGFVIARMAQMNPQRFVGIRRVDVVAQKCSSAAMAYASTQILFAMQKMTVVTGGFFVQSLCCLSE